PIAAAVDAGKVTATDGFTVPSSQDFDGQTIRDFSPHPTFDMTVAGIYARSYNTGTVQIAETITDEQRYEYMRSFGVGQPIDLGLPQQAGSVLVP
ncbi:penicillin-binding protein 2, partial [Xanthomonas citri pv. citri]|nr:penicillin-binding protein 2 [Xanthomonas citri pv. citri]